MLNRLFVCVLFHCLRYKYYWLSVSRNPQSLITHGFGSERITVGYEKFDCAEIYYNSNSANAPCLGCFKHIQ